MTDYTPFNRTTLETIMAGLTAQYRLAETGKEEVYMVPKDGASDEQIQAGVAALEKLVADTLDTEHTQYTDGVKSIEAVSRMGQPTMYRGADLGAIAIIKDIDNEIQTVQTELDMDIIRSVYTFDKENSTFTLLDRHRINHDNIAQAFRLLKHHFGVKIDNPQNLPIEALAYRTPTLAVPADIAEYAAQAMMPPSEVQSVPEAETAQPAEDVVTPAETEVSNRLIISSELSDELDKTYEEMQRQHEEQQAEQIKKIAVAYDVGQTPQEGTYFRPKETATAEELAIGEQALRDLTNTLLIQRGINQENTIIPMGAMGTAKMFRAVQDDEVRAVFKQIGQRVSTQKTVQDVEKAQKTEGISNTDVTKAAEPFQMVDAEIVSDTDKKEAEPLSYEAIRISAILDNAFTVVAGNLHAKDGVTPEQIMQIKERVTTFFETTDLIQDGQIIGLTPIHKDQADFIFQMMEATKTIRAMYQQFPAMDRNPAFVEQLFADYLEKAQNQDSVTVNDSIQPTETPAVTPEAQTPVQSVTPEAGTPVQPTVSDTTAKPMKPQPAPKPGVTFQFGANVTSANPFAKNQNTFVFNMGKKTPPPQSVSLGRQPAPKPTEQTPEPKKYEIVPYVIEMGTNTPQPTPEAQPVEMPKNLMAESAKLVQAYNEIGQFVDNIRNSAQAQPQEGTLMTPAKTEQPKVGDRIQIGTNENGEAIMGTVAGQLTVSLVQLNKRNKQYAIFAMKDGKPYQIGKTYTQGDLNNQSNRKYVSDIDASVNIINAAINQGQITVNIVNNINTNRSTSLIMVGNTVIGDTRGGGNALRNNPLKPRKGKTPNIVVNINGDNNAVNIGDLFKNYQPTETSPNNDLSYKGQTQIIEAEIVSNNSLDAPEAPIIPPMQKEEIKKDLQNNSADPTAVPPKKSILSGMKAVLTSMAIRGVGTPANPQPTEDKGKFTWNTFLNKTGGKNP